MLISKLKKLPLQLLTTKRSFIVFVILIIFFLSGCLNQYERKIIGSYEIGKYELDDSSKSIKRDDLPTLTIKSDKTFILSTKNKKIEGKWNADNYGDWVLADFFFNGQGVQGEILNDGIAIANPYQFFCPFFKNMEFKRIKK